MQNNYVKAPKQYINYIEALISKTKNLNLQELRLLRAYIDLVEVNNRELILNYCLWLLANYDFEVVVRDYYDLKFMNQEDLNDILTLINLGDYDTNSKCQQLFDTIEEDLKVRGL